MNKRIPAYIQVYNKMHKAIEDGVYESGEKIPSEAELEKKYGVSRITVRKAVDLLANDGFVHVKQGLGTIVASPSMNTSNYVTSFTEQLRAAGYTPAATSIHISRVLIPASIASVMNVPENKEMVCVQRLQLADNQPIALMNNYIMPELVPGIEEKPLNFTSLYLFLEEEYNVSINASRDIITARTADLAQATALHVPVGAPLIYLNRVSFSDGMPVLGDIVYINAYKHAFSFNLFGRSPRLPVEAYQPGTGE